MSNAEDSKRQLEALEKKGLTMRRKAHGPAYVKKTLAEADDFMMMFHDTTNAFCWGNIWTRRGLTTKQRTMLSLAITAALSQAPAVKMHTRTALRAGWTKEEIGEILLHVYVYAGVYASLSAFMAAKEVFDEMGLEAETKPAAAPSTTPRKSSNTAARRKSPLAEKGLQIRREVIGPENIDAWQAEIAGDDFMKMFFDFTHEFCFGAIWGRPALDYKTRSMLTLAITAGKSQAGAIRRHVRSALRAGLTKKEIGEIFLHAYIYAGVYASLSSFMAAREEFAVIEREQAEAGAGSTRSRRRQAPAGARRSQSR